jgi:hypothetical protein
MPAQETSVAKSRLGVSLVFVMAWLVTDTVAHASDVDSEHLFGFTEGADIGKKGEREAETETIGRFGKSGGSYAAFTQYDQVKWLPAQNLRVGANVALGYFDISAVPGLPDSQLATLQGVSFELRYHLMDRHSGPFGITMIAEPHWHRADDTSGVPSTSYGGTLTLAADRELIDNRLFGAVNLLYDCETMRIPLLDSWANSSKIGVSAAVAARVNGVLFIGSEIRYLRAYDGLGPSPFSGQAVFGGPTLYLQIAKGMAVSAAWNMQLSGSTKAGGALDLIHFERQQAKVRFNVNF